jgi:predicted ATP-dependent serine protease
MVTIAVGMVTAREQLETDQLENFVMVGELALNGAVRSVILKDTCLSQTPIIKRITCYVPYHLEEMKYNEDQLRQLLSSVPGIIL